MTEIKFVGVTELKDLGYKELQQQAKAYGVKASGKIDELRERVIEACFEHMADAPIEEEQDLVEDVIDVIEGEPVAQPVVGEEDDNLFDDDAPFEDAGPAAVEEPVAEVPNDKTLNGIELIRMQLAQRASGASANDGVTASGASKLFTFVRSDNCVVVFKQKGVEVKIGWSKKDFRCYMIKGGKAVHYSIHTAINNMRPFKDGIHGDIKLIVAALVKIKTKPAIIQAKERKPQQATDKPETTKSSRSRFVPIDAEWHAAYKEEQGTNYDARAVRAAYDQYLASTAQG